MQAALLEPVYIMGKKSQFGDFRHPPFEGFKPNCHQFRVEEIHGSPGARRQAARLPGPGCGGLVKGIHRTGIAGVGHNFAYQSAHFFKLLDGLQQNLRAFLQTALVGSQGWDHLLQGLTG